MSYLLVRKGHCSGRMSLSQKEGKERARRRTVPEEVPLGEGGASPSHSFSRGKRRVASVMGRSALVEGRKVVD